MSDRRTLMTVTVTGLLVAAIAAPVFAQGDTSAKRIALSNNYAGNSWRQSMLKSWETVTTDAVGAGIVAEAPAFTTAENQVTRSEEHTSEL